MKTNTVFYNEGFYCCDRKEKIEGILINFSNSIGIDVEVSTPLNNIPAEKRTLNKEGRLSIGFGIVPDEKSYTVHKINDYILGYDLGKRYQAHIHEDESKFCFNLYSHKNGLVTYDGCPIATIYDNSIYIYLPFFSDVMPSSSSIDRELKIIEIILSQAKKFILLNSEEKQLFINDINIKKTEKSINDLREVSKLSISKRVNYIKNELGSINDKIESLKEQLLSRIKLRNSMETELETVSEKGDSLYEEAFQKLVNINKYPKIKRVFSHNDSMAIETSCLFCLDQRTKLLHRLGCFLITFNFENSIVKWFNLHDSIYDRQAPHVFRSDGLACLGTSGAVFLELFKRFEVEMLVTEALLFIQTANPNDSAGQTIHEWPIVDGLILKGSHLKDCDENKKIFKSLSFKYPY